MNNLNNVVEAAFRHKPETRANNDVLWVMICRAICNQKGITNVEDFFLEILNREIPTSHTTAASASIVRKLFPELKPTEEQQNAKNEVRQQYINNYRNA